MPGRCDCYLSEMPEDPPDGNLQDSDTFSIKLSSLLMDMSTFLVGPDGSNGTHESEPELKPHHNVVMDGFLALIFGILALLGPFGLALVQSGLAQRRNVVSILLKPLIQFCCGVLIFWALGSAFSIGSGNFFIGHEYFFFNELDAHHFPQWFFQCCTAIYCVSIAASGGFERNRMRTDFVVSLLIPGFLFPLPAHWCWHREGWLVKAGFIDYAGGGVIHIVAGGCGMILVFLGKQRHHHPEHGIDYREALLKSGHNVTLAILGGLFNIIGCLAIQLGAGGDHFPQQYNATSLSKVIVNSSLSLACGGMAAFFIGRLSVKQWSVYRIFGGMIAGLVCTCPGTDVFYPWTCLITGSIGGLLYMASRSLMKAMHLDDPLEVASVHLVPGFLGLILLPLLYPEVGVFWAWSKSSAWFLAMNIAGAFTLLLWSFSVSLVVFGLLALCNRLKYDMETQVAGIDERTMREMALISATGDTFTMTGYSNNNNQSDVHHHVKFMDPSQSSLMNANPNTNQNESLAFRTSLSLNPEPLLASTQKELNLPRLVLEMPQESRAMPETPRRETPAMKSGGRMVSYPDTPKSIQDEVFHTEENPGPMEILSSITRENIRKGLQSLRHPIDSNQKRPSLAERRALTPMSHKQSSDDVK